MGKEYIFMDNLYVIIVIYNGIKWIENCISSVLKSTVQSKILIVDNGSTDGSLEYIRNTFPSVKIIPNSENLGFGKANNLGMEYALENNADYVYLLNQDAYVEPDTFEKLIDIHKKNLDFGVLSPLQVNAKKNHLDKNFAKYCNNVQCSNILDDYLLQQKKKEVYEIEYIMAAHWLISKECLQKVGGFNPTFPHYGEDENYIHRLHFHKLKCGIVPSAISVHDRENRPFPKEKIIHFNYIEFLKIKSNINTSSSYKMKKCFRNSITSFRLTFRYLTLKPIFNMVKFIFHSKKIEKNNFIAKNNKYSFLNYKDE